MPNNVQPANPTVVMPFSLSSAFVEEQHIECQVNPYQDGFSTRAALVINARRFFRLSKPLTYPQWDQLRTFYANHLIQPFYFYNPRETVPPFTWDPTGGATVGRYTVVFDGGWVENVQIPRASVSFGLREVQ